MLKTHDEVEHEERSGRIRDTVERRMKRAEKSYENEEEPETVFDDFVHAVRPMTDAGVGPGDVQIYPDDLARRMYDHGENDFSEVWEEACERTGAERTQDTP